MRLTTKETISRMNKMAHRLYPGLIIGKVYENCSIVALSFDLYGKCLFMLDIRGHTQDRITYEITEVITTLRHQGKL